MSSKSEKIILLAEEVYGKNKPKIIEGFDNAVIGIDVVGKRFVYSVKKCIRILKKQMPKEEAKDYFYLEIFENRKYKKNVVFCEDKAKKITKI